jgi:hypothetical protein
MANVRLTYNLPVSRVNGRPLSLNDIRHVSVYLSADSGANFSKLADVPPSLTEFTQSELEDGNWVFRLIVEDTLGQRSVPVDKAVVILPALPNPVSTVQSFVE